jgi:two-component system alkaline phosphatase synthesis response regulator PhoP
MLDGTRGVSLQGEVATEKGKSDSMKPKLVIADDEADIRRLIVFLLRSYDLYEAQNGKRALELIRQVQPDLVLLDILMPEMTGLEVLDAMRENPMTTSIPVILLSAQGQAVEIERGLQSGASRYLVKPFEAQSLRTCIAEVLREYGRYPVKE